MQDPLLFIFLSVDLTFMWRYCKGLCSLYAAAGEPPLLTSTSVITALRQALQSARGEAGEHGFCTMGNYTIARIYQCIFWADSRLAPSQWETLLERNAVSHWLGANLESALISDRVFSCDQAALSVLFIHLCQSACFSHLFNNGIVILLS